MSDGLLGLSLGVEPAERIPAEALWLKPALAGPEITDLSAETTRVPLTDRIQGEVRA